MYIGQQLAPGLGSLQDLLPGTYAIPQNPIRDAGTPLVPSPLAVMPQGYRVPHLAELMPGKFAEPENPIIRALAYGYTGTPSPKKAGMGCGCGGSCGCGGGMGDLSSWLTTSNGIGPVSLPNWVWVAAAFGAVYIFKKPTHDEHGKRIRY